jgi:hypothetical protein
MGGHNPPVQRAARLIRWQAVGFADGKQLSSDGKQKEPEMRIDKLALLNKVGFTVLLTTAGAWQVSMALMPEPIDASESVYRVSYEKLPHDAKTEYSAAEQAEF